MRMAKIVGPYLWVKGSARPLKGGAMSNKLLNRLQLKGFLSFGSESETVELTSYRFRV
jgi:hypothetical protein